MPSARTIKSAIKALDGFKQVVENEQIVHGTYVDDEINEELRSAGAICGGRRACAVGSLWIGAGVKPVIVVDDDDPESEPTVELPGVYTRDYVSLYVSRGEFLARKPGLKLAYETLNQVAVELWPRQSRRIGITDDPQGDTGAMENLFESGLLRGPGRPARETQRATNAEIRKLLALIAASRQRILGES